MGRSPELQRIREFPEVCFAADFAREYEPVPCGIRPASSAARTGKKDRKKQAKADRRERKSEKKQTKAMAAVGGSE